ncbi:AmmeMemoRadiSam system protein B [bacterium]|nr:AmmeMemoRadiSam system protein B [bacterium]
MPIPGSRGKRRLDRDPAPLLDWAGGRDHRDRHPKGETAMTTTRQPVLAGAWYPADPDRLRDRIDGYLAGAEPDRMPPGEPTVALVPHAGYEYSGPTAGKAYGLLRGRRYDAVFVLAPSHRAYLDRPALPGAEVFASPLGEVPIATDIVAALAATGHYVIDDRAHGPEHAVEIQLPFVQRALPDTPIVPILVPPLAASLRREVARALDPWRDARHLFVISTDLTHYGRDYGYVPFEQDVATRLEQLDTGALLKILAHDADGLRRYGEDTGITMCGLDAAALVLDVDDPPPHHAELLDYTRSADRTGDFRMSVSYAAVLICHEPVFTGLSADERGFLVELARRTVAATAGDERLPDPAATAAELGLELTGPLRERRGAFVTLKRDGHLRGCIGHIEGVESLVDTVVTNARSAARHDPRFDPVAPDELDRLEVEVSALTPLTTVPGPEAIELGRHGIVLARGEQRAVFLPQVATEQGWDLTTTLDHLALKAGLAPGAWREGCRFEVFEAEICED